jgi:hypothetical protein
VLDADIPFVRFGQIERHHAPGAINDSIHSVGLPRSLKTESVCFGRTKTESPLKPRMSKCGLSSNTA